MSAVAVFILFVICLVIAIPGSDGELRFVLEKQSSEGEGDRLAAICWFGKLCSAATPDEEKITRYFPFDKDGLEQAQVWLNEQVQNGRKIEI